MKTLSFYLHQVEVNFKQIMICWPVFSLVDYFVLKIEHRVFPQCVTCVTSALFLGNINMLRARKYLFALCTRKYQFALCFRVLSNLYVERSAYANVFNFNREKKHFERAKVNSRCFHWFPAAMFILNFNFHGILCQITRVPNIVHPQNFCT